MKKSLILLSALLLLLPTAALAKGGHGGHGGHGSHGGHSSHGSHGSKGSHSSNSGHSSKSGSNSTSSHHGLFGGRHSSSSTYRASSSGSPVSIWKSLNSQKSYVSNEANIPDLYQSGSLTNRMLYGSYLRPHYQASSVKHSEEERKEESSIWSKIKRHSDLLIIISMLAVLSISMIIAWIRTYK